jgi:hypothetical protein
MALSTHIQHTMVLFRVLQQASALFSMRIALLEPRQAPLTALGFVRREAENKAL